MSQHRKFLVLSLVLAASLLAGTALAASIDPVGRTVTTPQFTLEFSLSNPEEISYLSWNGSGNLTSTGVTSCGDPLEYFGNSWAAADSANFVSIVGWGQTGTWNPLGSSGVRIDSISDSASGCFGAADVPVRTNYRFFDHGPAANRIDVKRDLDFRDNPLEKDLRVYIPRLYPLTDYTEVLHPDASGTTLLTQISAACPFGCQISDWSDRWFAIHNPTTGEGVIVRRNPSSYDADLWVDEDLASNTTATGVLLLQPPGGFQRRVREAESLCFYDSSLWTPSLTLPAGCRP